MSFTVYRSSAGSGKTFTLVKEYLKIAITDTADPPRKFRNILAITFTNKASAEMKERILKHLAELSAADDSYMRDAIAKETGIDKATVQKRAGKVLAAILHHYSDFSIGTIDSFVHRIVRAFAYELKLPVNFEVETDADALLQQAIDLLISRIGHDEQLTRALVEFTESKTDSEKSWKIEDDLHNFSSTLLKDESLGHIEKLRGLEVADFLKIREELAVAVTKFERSVIAAATKACKTVDEAGIPNENFHGGSRGIGTWFRNLAAGRFDKMEPNTSVLGSIHENKWAGSKAKGSDKSAVEGLKDILTSFYQEIQEIKTKDYGRYQLYKLMYRNMYSLAVLNETEKMLNDFKSSRNILHISEFNKLIATVVLEQPVPFIYEHMGERYSHFLLDEFQDTSELQWQNLLPLIDNSLAEGNFNMVVGDGKQAIYRWRGGEVEQFVKLPKLKNSDGNALLKEREASLESHFESKNLDTNFRSKTEVVDFNNRFFECVSGGLEEELKPIYAQLHQKSNPKNKGGGVSLEFVSTEEDLTDNMHETIFHRIEELKKDGFRLKDIAILTRNNRDGSGIAMFLSANSIPVISSDSLLLKNAASVHFLCALLTCLRDGSNVIPMSSVAEFLLREKKKTRLDAVLRELSKAPYSAFAEFLRNEGYDFHPAFLSRLPLYELCEELIRIFDLGKQPDPYLLFFLDEVMDYSLKNNDHLSDFLDWWEERKETSSLAFPAGAEAITIMTIHKSKGLEFPAVIFPFANWYEGRSNDVWVELKENGPGKLGSALLPLNAQLEETEFSAVYKAERSKKQLDNINLLYVAMTRPVERLYILTDQPKGLKNVSKQFVTFLEQQGLLDGQRTEFRFGEFAKKEKGPASAEASAGKENFVLEHYVSSGWRDRLRVRTEARELWETEEQTKKKEYGLSLHAALSRIKSLDDIASSLEAMMKEGLLDDTERKALETKLKNLLSLPEIKPYFERQAGIITETEIIDSEGVTYRPDRVITDGKKATVIDYKTGKPREEHKAQLNKYAELLGEMGFKEVKKVLIYTGEERVEVI